MDLHSNGSKTRRVAATMKKQNWNRYSGSVVIEQGIPAPLRTGSGRKRIYPWLEMEIGDSFIVGDGNPRRMFSIASIASKRHGMRFACASTTEGVRVWRIE